MTFPTNAALEAAVIEAPDDDAPRLVYADWLDEHGDTDRAEFIRVQCRLAEMSPADPDWVDMTGRHDELTALLTPRFSDLKPPSPVLFSFGEGFYRDDQEPFRRGFPYLQSCQLAGAEWTPEMTARVATHLGRLMQSSTVRGLQCCDIPTGRFVDLLSAPALTQLSAFSFDLSPTPWQDDVAAAYRVLATSPAVGRVRHLGLRGFVPAAGVTALARAESLDAVRRLTILRLSAPPAELASLTASGWFRQVRHLRISLPDSEVAGPVIAGLEPLTELHTLDLPGLAPQAIPAMAGREFPSLARLSLYKGPLHQGSAEALVRGQFPRLIALEARRLAIQNSAFRGLLRASWFGQLRVLDLTDNKLGDKAVAALAAHPVAKKLRVLRLGDNVFGKGGLRAIGRPGAFPELTELDLSSRKQEAKEDDVLAFVSELQLPRLRHLRLDGWPLGDVGAKALAVSPALAGLRFLILLDCGVAEAGSKALLASPHLRDLVCRSTGVRWW